MLLCLCRRCAQLSARPAGKPAGRVPDGRRGGPAESPVRAGVRVRRHAGGRPQAVVRRVEARGRPPTPTRPAKKASAAACGGAGSRRSTPRSNAASGRSRRTWRSVAGNWPTSASTIWAAGAPRRRPNGHADAPAGDSRRWVERTDSDPDQAAPPPPPDAADNSEPPLVRVRTAEFAATGENPAAAAAGHLADGTVGMVFEVWEDSPSSSAGHWSAYLADEWDDYQAALDAWEQRSEADGDGGRPRAPASGRVRQMGRTARRRRLAFPCRHARTRRTALRRISGGGRGPGTLIDACPCRRDGRLNAGRPSCALPSGAVSNPVSALPASSNPRRERGVGSLRAEPRTARTKPEVSRSATRTLNQWCRVGLNVNKMSRRGWRSA